MKILLLIHFTITFQNKKEFKDVIKIKLPKKVIEKYNFGNKLLYNISDNKIWLWNFSKYEDLNGNIGSRRSR